jgi:hypothetical protein
MIVYNTATGTAGTGTAGVSVAPGFITMIINQLLLMEVHGSLLQQIQKKIF